MGKGIGPIYKYDQRNLSYPSPNTTFVLTQLSDCYIQNQHTITSDASVGAHSLASSVSYQSTSHQDNTDVNDYDDSQSFETPRKNNHSSY